MSNEETPEYKVKLPKKEKPVVISAIQPTSYAHLGNYLGAIRNWVDLAKQDKYECLFMTVNLHSITVPQDPVALRKNTLDCIAFYIAAGLDPEKVTLFIQSQVSGHAELAWVLNCFTHMGELGRMTQYKDKSSKQGQNIGAGLFNYPVLMAADILLYDTEMVPVGADQKQHLELARDLAGRVNQRFEKEVLKVPEPFIAETGAKIMDLVQPEKKMSKSAENQKGVVYLNETDKAISKKIKGATTDSGSEIRYSDEQAGVKNLIEIQCAITGMSANDIVASYEGKLYGHLKVDTAKIVTDFFGPIRDQAKDLVENREDDLMDILKTGAEKADAKAEQTLARVYDEVGFIRRR